MHAGLITRHHTIPISGWPAQLKGLRIAHISDLHFRRRHRTTLAARELLQKLDYDLLAVTGDCCDFRRRWPRAIGMMRDFFGPVAQAAPIYAVLGNHDDPRIADAPDVPVRFLRNESVPIELCGARFELAGLDQSDPSAENIEAALKDRRAESATVLLAHYPSTVFRLPRGHVALQLSGHTHGGQIRLPRLGCVWAHDRIPVRMAWGLHRVADTVLHVTAGIGVSLPLYLRLNCAAEIAVLSIVPGETYADLKSGAGLHPGREKVRILDED